MHRRAYHPGPHSRRHFAADRVNEIDCVECRNTDDRELDRTRM